MGLGNHGWDKKKPWAPTDTSPAGARPWHEAAGGAAGLELPSCSRAMCWYQPRARGLAGRGGSAGNLAMAVWSALGFLFLPRSWSCTRSRLRRPRPREDARTSPTAVTLRHTQVRGAVPQGTGTPLWGGGDSALALCRVTGCVRAHPAQHRDVSQHPPAPAAPLLQGKAPQDCNWDQSGSQWSWVLGHIQAWHLTPGLSALSSC